MQFVFILCAPLYGNIKLGIHHEISCAIFSYRNVKCMLETYLILIKINFHNLVNV